MSRFDLLVLPSYDERAASWQFLKHWPIPQSLCTVGEIPSVLTDGLNAYTLSNPGDVQGIASALNGSDNHELCWNLKKNGRRALYEKKKFSVRSIFLTNCGESSSCHFWYLSQVRFRRTFYHRYRDLAMLTAFPNGSCLRYWQLELVRRLRTRPFRAWIFSSARNQVL
jgi:hypothetical protein